jgi:hypothetical protein
MPESRPSGARRGVGFPRLLSEKMCQSCPNDRAEKGTSGMKIRWPRAVRGAAATLMALMMSVVILSGGLLPTPVAAEDAVQSTADGTWWQPGVGITWQIQLNRPPTPGQIIPGLDAYEVDLFDTTPQRIDQIQATGAKVICYFSAGTYENWRPDRKKFPERVIGLALDDWPGERYLDIRHKRVRQVMKQRLNLAVGKGCDAVDPDNVDGYRNRSGFPLKAKHQLSFNRFLANEAHKRGLAIGLKNDLPQIRQLVNVYDFAVNEQCFQYRECHVMKPFIDQGKSVLSIEYGPFKQTARQVCPKATPLGFSTLVKKLSLDAARFACPTQAPPP